VIILYLDKRESLIEKEQKKKNIVKAGRAAAKWKLVMRYQAFN